jgi:predicted MFS family arabinose efflux permease
MLSDKFFLTFCLCGFVSHFAWQMGWPLFFYYNVDYAHLNEFQLSLASVASGFAEFLSYSFWNRLIEKKGSNHTLVIAAATLAINPFCFLVLWKFPVILLMNMVLGISTAGFNLSLFTTLLETLPAVNKTAYISAFNTITNITGFIAPLIGVWIYSNTNIYLAFGITGVFRMAGAILYLVRLRKVVHSRLESSSIRV